MRRWKLSTGTLLLIIGLTALVAFVVFASVFASSAAPWTGFAADLLPPGAPATPVVIYDQDRDLWDWLQLLLVPLVLAIGGFFFQRAENRNALEVQERREREAQRLEDQQSQDAVLQAYLDQMTGLLLHENLLVSRYGDPVRTVARARTLTTVKQLDGVRKGRVVQFLYEAQLVGRPEKAPIIDLEGVDLQRIILNDMSLSGIVLYLVDFQDADLRGVMLAEAAFSAAKFVNANLQGTKFFKASLNGANLTGANLQHASLRGAYAEMVNLEGANLTDALLDFADFRKASFVGAILANANFTESDVTGADFTNAKLDGAIGLPDHFKPKP